MYLDADWKIQKRKGYRGGRNQAQMTFLVVLRMRRCSSGTLPPVTAMVTLVSVLLKKKSSHQTLLDEPVTKIVQQLRKQEQKVHSLSRVEGTHRL